MRRKFKTLFNKDDKEENILSMHDFKINSEVREGFSPSSDTIEIEYDNELSKSSEVEYNNKVIPTPGNILSKSDNVFEDLIEYIEVNEWVIYCGVILLVITGFVGLFIHLIFIFNLVYDSINTLNNKINVFNTRTLIKKWIFYMSYILIIGFTDWLLSIIMEILNLDFFDNICILITYNCFKLFIAMELFLRSNTFYKKCFTYISLYFNENKEILQSIYKFNLRLIKMIKETEDEESD